MPCGTRQIKREVEPLIGLLPSIILGALRDRLRPPRLGAIRSARIRGASALIVPASISTILVGFLLLTTRYKAISQAVGYLILENGIYIFGMLLVEAIPLVVEMGMLLDLLVGVFVISIIATISTGHSPRWIRAGWSRSRSDKVAFALMFMPMLMAALAMAIPSNRLRPLGSCRSRRRRIRG